MRVVVAGAPFEGDSQVLGHALAVMVAITEVALGHGVAFHHGLLVPEHGLRVVSLGGLAARVHPTQVALCVWVALLRGTLVPATTPKPKAHATVMTT